MDYNIVGMVFVFGHQTNLFTFQLSDNKVCTLQMFTGYTGSLQGFPVVEKPCNIYRLRGNPIIIMGFPSNL